MDLVPLQMEGDITELPGRSLAAEEGHHKAAPPAPPKTLEEFIAMEKLDTWPEHITSEYPLPVEPGSVLGGKEAIFALLREAAPLDDQLGILSTLENKVLDLENHLNKYSDSILSSEERPSRIKDHTFYSNFDSKGTFMTEPIEHDTGPSGSRDRSIEERKRHSVDTCVYPGFNLTELTELPGKIETPQLLDRATKAQEFELGFSKFWKKTFLSEASVALVQDMFWWLFLKLFPPTSSVTSSSPRQPPDDVLLFDRMSDSFAALFLSVHPDLKDKIFAIYPDVLAQAMFSIFHDAFHYSRGMFGPKFKEELINYCWELTSGIKPVPQTWKRWNIAGLLKQDESGGKVRSDQGNLPYDFPSLYSTLENLEQVLAKGSEHVGDPGVAPTHSGQEVADDSSKPTGGTFKSRKTRTIRESSQAGPGLQMERVLFYLGSPSPLIRHFLTSKNLPPPSRHQQGVSHAQIAASTLQAPTYRALIDEHRARGAQQLKQYTKLKADTERDIKRILIRKARVAREINKLKEGLGQMKITGHDLKVLIDRMLVAMSDKSKSVSTAQHAERERQTTAADGETSELSDSEEDFVGSGSSSH